MKQKTEVVLLKEIRQLKRKIQDLEIENKGLERRNRLAENKIDYLNGLLKKTDGTIQQLKEDLEYARSLNERLP
jgi:chromosome segregation ATPase